MNIQRQVSSTNTEIFEDKLKKTRMKSITVIKHLFILAIISIILNSIFILLFLAGYFAIAVLYGVTASIPYYSSGRELGIFATIMVSISIAATTVSYILTMVGSCLAMSPNKKTRTASLVLSVFSIWILFTHIITNIIVETLSFADVSGNKYAVFNAALLVPIVVVQSILLIYNSIFACVIGCSLRQVADE